MLCHIAQDVPEILDLHLVKGDIGKNTNISCNVSPTEATVDWLFNNEPLNIGERLVYLYIHYALFILF